jgi:hypothetical protein
LHRDFLLACIKSRNTPHQTTLAEIFTLALLVGYSYRGNCSPRHDHLPRLN